MTARRTTRTKKKRPTATQIRIARQKKLFLKCLRETGSVSQAARYIKKDRSWPYKHRRDEAFAAEWDHVWNEVVVDPLEQSAYQRARFGSIETYVDKDGIERERVRHHDVLTIFMLKSYRPEVFNVSPRTPPGQGPLGHTFDAFAEFVAKAGIAWGSRPTSDDPVEAHAS